MIIVVTSRFHFNVSRSARTFWLASLLLITTNAYSQGIDKAKETIGAFTYFERTDDVMGDVNRFITTEVDLEGKYRDGLLTFRCVESGFQIFIAQSWGLSEEAVPTRYRFDDSTASEVELWYPSTSGVGAFLPDSTAITFVGQARFASQVIIRLTNIFGEDMDYTFPLKGFNEAISRLPCVDR